MNQSVFRMLLARAEEEEKEGRIRITADAGSRGQRLADGRTKKNDTQLDR